MGPTPVVDCSVISYSNGFLQNHLLQHSSAIRSWSYDAVCLDTDLRVINIINCFVIQWLSSSDPEAC